VLPRHGVSGVGSDFKTATGHIDRRVGVMTAETLIVIGGGQAAASLIAKRRDLGGPERIVLISNETFPPYQRPPLSKKYLMGDTDLARLYLRPESWYCQNGIELHLGQCVAAIDRARGVVCLGSGETLPYDRLALTTGATPRRLPGAIGGSLDGVFTMRSLVDADAMRSFFASGVSVLVVGGGYIGLEAAAVAAKMGLQVTLIETAERILRRVAAEATSNYFRELHVNNGVTIREQIGLAHLIGRNGHVVGAELSNGEQLECNFVIVGIGVDPNDRLAREAGLDVEDGILVNSRCWTSDPGILAAGDCARFPYGNTTIRLESVQNAIDQGEAAARALSKDDAPYAPYPWFWSEQFDIKLQIAGLNVGYDSTVVRAGKRPGAQSIWYYRGDNLLAVDAMNDGGAYMLAGRLLKAGRSPAKDQVQDPTSDLRRFLA